MPNRLTSISVWMSLWIGSAGCSRRCRCAGGWTALRLWRALAHRPGARRGQRNPVSRRARRLRDAGGSGGRETAATKDRRHPFCFPATHGTSCMTAAGPRLCPRVTGRPSTSRSAKTWVRTSGSTSCADSSRSRPRTTGFCAVISRRSGAVAQNAGAIRPGRLRKACSSRRREDDEDRRARLRSYLSTIHAGA